MKKKNNMDLVAISNIEKEETIVKSLFEEQVFETINLSKATPERKALLLSAIISDPELETWLRQHYYDVFGSEDLILSRVDETLDKKLNTILEGIIETCNENIEVCGLRNDNTEVFINLSDRTHQETRQWMLEQLRDNTIKDYESICSTCGERTNDKTETKFDDAGDPYCPECYEELKAKTEDTEKKPDFEDLNFQQQEIILEGKRERDHEKETELNTL